MTKVEAFKKLIRLYGYVTVRAKELDEEIDNRYYQATGVKGVNPFANKGTTNPLIKEYARLRNADIVEAMETQKRWCTATAGIITQVVNNMDIKERQIIFDVFINDIGYAKACEKYGYTNSKYLFREINRIIQDAIDDTNF